MELLFDSLNWIFLGGNHVRMPIKNIFKEHTKNQHVGDTPISYEVSNKMGMRHNNIRIRSLTIHIYIYIYMLVCLYIYNFQTNKQTKSTQILQNSIQGKLPNSRLPKLMQIRTCHCYHVFHIIIVFLKKLNMISKVW